MSSSITPDQLLLHCIKHDRAADMEVVLDTYPDLLHQDIFCGTTWAHVAVEWNCPQALPVLVRRGLNVDTASDLDVTPLAQAMQDVRDVRELGVISTLLDLGADPNKLSMRSRPLHKALALEDSQYAAAVTKLLLAHGADPEAVNGNELKPLHHAAMQGHFECAVLLISNGANIYPDRREDSIHSGWFAKQTWRRQPPGLGGDESACSAPS